MPLDGSVKLTDGGNVAADLIISGGGVAVKYNVYLSENAVKLQFRSTDRGRGELAARLLRLTGVNAEVKSKGNGDGWYVRASTVVLAAAREELRKALAVIIKTALARAWWTPERRSDGWRSWRGEWWRGRVRSSR
jgi:hypothetical protein